jgi:uncharacterized protein (DUF488 family)
MLVEYGVDEVADVRRFPGSRRSPQFGAGMLEQTLQSAGIHYQHLPDLGGRRRPFAESLNNGWRTTSFRGYADYMATPGFDTAMTALMALSEDRRVAMLCSEAVWWRCHRRLIADALVVHGRAVEHILGPGSTMLHQLTPFARIDDRRIVYPAHPPL